MAKRNKGFNLGRVDKIRYNPPSKSWSIKVPKPKPGRLDYCQQKLSPSPNGSVLSNLARKIPNADVFAYYKSAYNRWMKALTRYPDYAGTSVIDDIPYKDYYFKSCESVTGAWKVTFRDDGLREFGIDTNTDGGTDGNGGINLDLSDLLNGLNSTTKSCDGTPYIVKDGELVELNGDVQIIDHPQQTLCENGSCSEGLIYLPIDSEAVGQDVKFGYIQYPVSPESETNGQVYQSFGANIFYQLDTELINPTVECDTNCVVSTDYGGAKDYALIEYAGKQYLSNHPPISFAVTEASGDTYKHTWQLPEGCGDITEEFITTEPVESYTLAVGGIESIPVSASEGVEYYAGKPKVKLVWSSGNIESLNSPISYDLQQRLLIADGVDYLFNKEITNWSTSSVPGGIQVDWGGGDIDILTGSSWSQTTSYSVGNPVIIFNWDTPPSCYIGLTTYFNYIQFNSGLCYRVVNPNNNSILQQGSRATAARYNVGGYGGIAIPGCGTKVGSDWQPYIHLNDPLLGFSVVFETTYSVKTITYVYNGTTLPPTGLRIISDTGQFSERQTSTPPIVTFVSPECNLTINFTDLTSQVININGSCPTSISAIKNYLKVLDTTGQITEYSYTAEPTNFMVSYYDNDGWTLNFQPQNITYTYPDTCKPFNIVTNIKTNEGGCCGQKSTAMGQSGIFDTTGIHNPPVLDCRTDPFTQGNPPQACYPVGSEYLGFYEDGDGNVTTLYRFPTTTEVTDTCSETTYRIDIFDATGLVRQTTVCGDPTNGVKITSVDGVNFILYVGVNGVMLDPIAYANYDPTSNSQLFQIVQLPYQEVIDGIGNKEYYPPEVDIQYQCITRYAGGNGPFTIDYYFDKTLNKWVVNILDADGVIVDTQYFNKEPVINDASQQPNINTLNQDPYATCTCPDHDRKIYYYDQSKQDEGYIDDWSGDNSAGAPNILGTRCCKHVFSVLNQLGVADKYIPEDFPTDPEPEKYQDPALIGDDAIKSFKPNDINRFN
jgi:hypothetical protein